MSIFDIFFRCDNNAKLLSSAKEKKEKRKEKGFPTPFPKRKEINKEKKSCKTVRLSPLGFAILLQKRLDNACGQCYYEVVEIIFSLVNYPLAVKALSFTLLRSANMTINKHFITSEPTIVPNKEHCDVFINGTFYCSCDNIKRSTGRNQSAETGKSC